MKDEAFKQLFDAYKNRLYGYVLAIAHSDYIAEEITQEIFIKVRLAGISFIRSITWKGYIHHCLQ